MTQLSPLAFPEAATSALQNEQLRHNLSLALRNVRGRRAAVIEELPDWERLREEGERIRNESLSRLDELLVRLADQVEGAGGHVHWALDAGEATEIISGLIADAGATEVVKMKSLVTEEIGLNEALARSGVRVVETDLAELILQLGDEAPAHMGVPSLHLNQAQIREILAAGIGNSDLLEDPHVMCRSARDYLRETFMRAEVGISGVNFAVAETGSVCIVESEGNGRMCTTLPRTLIAVMGVEKVLPSWQDLGTMLRLLPRSSSAERMTPYVSIWTGIDQDGPDIFHLVLLDGKRTSILADEINRQTLRCIRCSACLNVCPVFEQTGGHAYRSVYSGPIGAILSPQLNPTPETKTLPFASSLCGACLDVCPVKIDIPRVLVHLRSQFSADASVAERLVLRGAASVLMGRRRFEFGQRLVRVVDRVCRSVGRGPVGMTRWLEQRDLPPVPSKTFRSWWRTRSERAPR